MNARTPQRRIVRPLSHFKVGQQVTVEGNYNGDYHGTVTKTHNHLTLHVDATIGEATRPGVTVKVTRWEGIDYTGAVGTAFEPFYIDAHDAITVAR